MGKPTDPQFTFYERDKPYDGLNTKTEKENRTMPPTAEQIKAGMPNALTKDATEEQLREYYTKLEEVGTLLVKGFFSTNKQTDLTGRRPLGALPTTSFFSDANKLKALLKTDETFQNRVREVGYAVELASQQLWLKKESISDHNKLNWEEKEFLRRKRVKNEDFKKQLLTTYLGSLEENRRLKGTRALENLLKTMKKGGGAKPEPEEKKQKVKPIINKTDIDTILKMAEQAENELTKAKADFDRAMDKVRDVHSKLRQELTITKRLMDRAE